MLMWIGKEVVGYTGGNKMGRLGAMIQEPVSAENLDEFLQFPHASRFGKERIGAERIGAVNLADLVGTSEDDDQETAAGKLAANPAQEFECIGIRDVQIEEDNTGNGMGCAIVIGRVAAQIPGGFFAGANPVHGVHDAGPDENAVEHQEIIHILVHNENARCAGH